MLRLAMTFSTGDDGVGFNAVVVRDAESVADDVYPLRLHQFPAVGHRTDEYFWLGRRQRLRWRFVTPRGWSASLVVTPRGRSLGLVKACKHMRIVDRGVVTISGWRHSHTRGVAREQIVIGRRYRARKVSI